MPSIWVVSVFFQLQGLILLTGFYGCHFHPPILTPINLPIPKVIAAANKPKVT